ncbi:MULTISPECIES: ABC transporter ATP-binding protein [Rhodomicrobium]|uniref:ABC transporter ATP-binding protein n=1 Tax=Rhodomicrobium TaxID=1068 RepID=UPI000B4BC634|nr:MULTISPECIES: ABC transporter ATP-binding protein [Rhodomicrobium]
MFSWFETRIDPVRPSSLETPPAHWTQFFWHFVRQVWPGFLAILSMGFFVGIIEVSLFAFLGQLVDLAKAAPTPADFFSQQGGTLLWMAFIALVLRPIFAAFHIIAINQVINANFTNMIRWQTHRYVLRQSLSFFQNDFAGRIANKIIQTGPSLREAMVQISDAMWFVLIYTGGAILLFSEADWRLIVPLLIWLVFYVLSMVYFVPRLKVSSTAMSEVRSTLTGRIVDSYTNITTVKLFAHTQGEDEYAKEALLEHNRTFHAMLRLTTSYEVAVIILNGFLIVGTSGLALWLWSQDAITLGAVALATGLVIRINNMAGWIMFVMTNIFENVGTVQEGMETISRPISVVDTPAARELRVPKGEVRYEGVTFHYGREGGLIENLTFSIKPGEKVGLVGRSGAGKSTLVNLLLRFHDLEGGRILIDGQDIASVTQDSLRANIGVVTQDTSLLHRSVFENIRYGRKEASDEEVIAAAKRAHAHEFIEGLMDMRGRAGYMAHVGERGVKLSGGQRQRVAIARVLLKDAPILILDEATSALDSEVEAAIQEQFNNLMQGKTVIAIAHRLSTIAAMDRLIIMDQGRIVEEGTHEQLLKRGGIYAQLWSRQSGGFMIEDRVA